jgi:hypothetical protein
MFGLPPILAHIGELAIVLLLTAVAAGVGLRVLGWLRASPGLSTGERVIFGVALGYGALGFSMLGMGLLGALSLPVGLTVLGVLVILAYGPLAANLAALSSAVRRALPALRYPPNVYLLAVVVVCVSAALIKALVPVATQDDLMYHLALPRRYIEAGAISFYPDSTYSLFPQIMEMLYTWGLLLGSDRLAVLLAFSASLIGPAAVGLYAKRYLAAEASGIWRALPILAPAIFLSVPLVGYVMRAANTDLAQASFDLLAVFAAWLGVFGIKQATETQRSAFSVPHLLLAGLCCGLAFSTKYYGFAMAVVLGAALVGVALYRWRKDKKTGLKEYAAGIAAFGLGFLSLVSLWGARNVIAAGNPVWPLAGSIFGGAYWSPARELAPETLLGSAPPLGLTSLWTGVDYLWTATTRPPLHIDNQTHEVSLGYLLLPLLFLLPLARWRAALIWVGYAAGGYLLLWALFFSRTSARYLSTFFLIAALLGAYAVISIAVRFKVVGWVIGGMVGVVLGWLAVQAAWSAGPYLGTTLAFDKAAENEYLDRYMEDNPLMGYIEQNVPPSARIYVWDGQPRGYYIERPYVYARLVPLYTGFGSEPEAWRARLRELGITHVVVHSRDILAPGQPPGADPALEVGRRFAERYFTPPLFQVGNFILYELK